MDERTELELAVNADEAAVDEAVHKLWLNKELLAPLLKAVIPEYEDHTVEEIISMIDADICRGDTVSDTGSLRAEDRGTEFYSRTEKLSRFDVHVKSKNPKLSGEELLVMLHIDLEIQNRYYVAGKGAKKPYPPEKRAVYYVARELCSQLSYSTHVTDYGALEKCYSIWVMVRNVPKELQNSVSLIELKKRDLIGDTPDMAENYDLMSVVFVRLGSEVPEDSVFEYIESVNAGKTEAVKKYVDIESRPQVAEEVKTMEGFAEIFMEKGIEKGIEKGSERHLIDQICRKLRRGKDVPQIADEVEEDEIRVQLISDIAGRFAPDFDTDQVFEAVWKELVEA